MNARRSASQHKPATLADVAAQCGVAPSTVSRALSSPLRVNHHTRERILAAARELNYVPNSQARALVSGKTHTIAVIIHDITNPFYFDMIRGIQQQARTAGLAAMLLDTDESDQTELDMMHRLRHPFDGAILAASRLSDRLLLKLNEEMPIVAINRQTRGVAHVFIDTPSGITQAFEHLVSLGHRDVCYASGPTTSWSNERRWRSLKAACDSAGITCRRIGPFTSQRMSDGAAAADAFLNTPATACIAFNDLLAIGMLGRLRQRGVAVPGQVSLVGCDDIFGSDFCNPPLTTLTSPTEKAGRLAVTKLVTLMEHGPSSLTQRPTTLPTHLTVRASTGPAAHAPHPITEESA